MAMDKQNGRVKKKLYRLILAALSVTMALSLASCSLVEVHYDDILDDLFPFAGTFADDTDAVDPDELPIDSDKETATLNKYEYTGLSEAVEYLDSIGDFSFDGSTVFIKTTATDMLGQLFVDGEVDDEDIYSATIYERNRMVEERFDCELHYVATTIDQMIADMNAAVEDEEYYADLLAVTQAEVAMLAKEGCLFNLRSIPFFTSYEEYFNEYASDALSAGYYDYGIIGAATIVPDSISCVYVNLDLLGDTYDGDLEAIAKAGDFTWDVLLTAAEGMKISCGTIIAGEGGLADIVSASAGLTMVKNAQNEVPAVTYPDMADRVLDVCRTLVFERKSLTAGAEGGGLPAFLGGVSAFHLGRLANMNDLALVSFDWTVLPIPKMSADDANYKAYTDADTLVMCVPVNTANPDGAAILMRGMSAASSGYLRDAYVEYHMYHTVRRSSALTLIELIYETPFFNFEGGLGTASSDITKCTNGLIRSMARERTEDASKTFDDLDKAADKALKKYYEPRN